MLDGTTIAECFFFTPCFLGVCVFLMKSFGDIYMKIEFGIYSLALVVDDPVTIFAFIL